MTPGLFTLFKLKLKRNSLITAVAGTALWFYYDYTVTRGVMVNSCKRATIYGDAKLRDPNNPVRHITVILNPIACKRKSKKLYTKWVEPLLNLAGIKVSLIETESPNQAYDLMKIMSNCDGVAIVGGDGTVHEVLNGLLHRPDNLQACLQYPLAIIPAGMNNSIARYIHSNLDYRNQKEFLIQSTLRLVESTKEKHDVLKITPLEGKSQRLEQQLLPTYALRDIRYGIYQDNFFKVSGYSFYQNNIKPIWLRFKNLFNNKNPKPQIESLAYTEPCVGCSKCYEKHKLQRPSRAIEGAEPNIEEQSANKRWWSKLAPVPVEKVQQSEEETRELELAKRDNSECDRYIKVGQLEEITDFRACMMGDKKVRMSLGRDGAYTFTDVIETQDVRLKVSQKLDDEMKMSSQPKDNVEANLDAEAEAEEKKKKEEEEKKKTKFLIDGQPVQAHSAEICAIRKPITIFTGSLNLVIEDRASLAQKRRH